MNVTTELLNNIKEGGLESLGIYYGIYAGIVENNKDPNNLFRLKIKIPSLLNNQISDWAKPKGIFAGKNYGIFALPQKNDNVWVTFEGGDIRFPIWEYGAIARTELPKEAKGNSLVFIAKGKNKIIIDEDGKIEISNENNSLKNILDELFQCITDIQIITPIGNGIVSPADVTKIEMLKQKVNKLLK